MNNYHGLDRQSASEIELKLEHLALHPSDQTFMDLEDSILSAIPKIDLDKRNYWWKAYCTGVELYLHHV